MSDARDKRFSDRDLDARIRAAAEMGMPTTEKRMLRVHLLHLLRYHHRRRANAGVMTLAFTLLFLGLGTEMYLGSDSFNLESYESSIPDTEAFISTTGNRGYGKAVSAVRPGENVRRQGELITEMILSGDYETTGMYGVTFKGHVLLQEEMLFMVDGQPVEVTTGRDKIPPEIYDDYIDFVMTRLDAVQSEADSGFFDPLPDEVVDFPDVSVSFRKWRLEEDPWGELIVWKGRALPDSN